MRTTNEMMSEYTNGEDVSESLVDKCLNLRWAERGEERSVDNNVRNSSLSIKSSRFIKHSRSKNREISNTKILNNSLLDDNTFIVSSILLCPIIHSICSSSQFKNLHEFILLIFLDQSLHKIIQGLIYVTISPLLLQFTSISLQWMEIVMVWSWYNRKTNRFFDWYWYESEQFIVCLSVIPLAKPINDHISTFNCIETEENGKSEGNNREKWDEVTTGESR